MYSEQDKRDARDDLDSIIEDLTTYLREAVRKEGISKEMLERNFWLENPNIYLHYNLCEKILRE